MCIWYVVSLGWGDLVPSRRWVAVVLFTVHLSPVGPHCGGQVGPAQGCR